MFHYHPLIDWEAELEIAPIGTKRMRFLDPILDKRAARSDFRDDFLPNLVNINRDIRFIAGTAGPGRLHAGCCRFAGSRAAACLQKATARSGLPSSSIALAAWT